MSSASLVLAGYLLCGGAVSCNDDLMPHVFPYWARANHYDDGTEIGRAMNICEAHSHAPTFVYPENPASTPREYDRGFEGCYRIRQEWNKGEEARQIRERQEQFDRDRVLIEGLAKRLESK